MTQHAAQIGMADPEHLKRWLRASGRRFLVFNSCDLVDALVWPAGHQTLQQMIHAYGECRSLQESEIPGLLRNEVLQPGETIEAIEELTQHFVAGELRSLIGHTEPSAADREQMIGQAKRRAERALHAIASRL